jgi:predicted ATPase
MADRQRTVALLDDLLWGDEATLEALPSLAAAVENRPVLCLGAYRSDDVPRTSGRAREARQK